MDHEFLHLSRMNEHSGLTTTPERSRRADRFLAVVVGVLALGLWLTGAATDPKTRGSALIATATSLLLWARTTEHPTRAKWGNRTALLFGIAAALQVVYDWVV